MKAIWISGAALGVTGALALATLVGRGHRAHLERAAGLEESASSADTMAALVDQMGRMRGELELLRAQQAAAGVRPAQPPAAGGVSAPDRSAARDDPPATPRSAADAQAETFRYVKHADQVLAAEPKDKTWGDARDLPRRVEGVLPSGSNLESVSCGTTLCRVETTHATLSAYRTFTRSMSFWPKPGDTEIKTFWPGPTAFLVVSDPGGETDAVRAVAYLARPGSNLPSAP
ncbi:MAG TPA: hypothetical protein VKU41_06020 [Polyangiaceae bacterium]|nr:hypothetical protein [Polyangiaceae bacterium]